MPSRWLLAVSASHETLDSIRARVDRSWPRASLFDGPGVRLISDQPPQVALPNGRGGVFGDLFRRVDHHRVAAVDHRAGEVIVASGGDALASQFWGGYLAIVLTPDDAVHVVRSPFGALGAYRLDLHDVTIVASDVGVLIDGGWLNPQLDWEFVRHFLAYPFQRARRTGFQGVSELPSGSKLTLRGSQDPVERGLWTPWAHVRPTDEGREAERLEAETRRCVRAWTEDRHKLVLELSGGVDSSILAACLWDAPVEVRCANMVSPSRDGDERIFARAVAERLGLSLHEIALAPRDLDLVAPPSIRRPRPSAHALLGSWDAALARFAGETGADAFISGGGGDNVFFNTHGSTPAADALRCGRIGQWVGAVSDLATLHGCSVWQAGVMSLKRAVARPGAPWRPDARFLAPGMAAPQIEPHPWLERPAAALPGKLDHVKALMAVQNYLDGFARAEQAPILTPLLSEPVVELCLSIPSWTWIGGGQDRAVAREAFRSRLPALIVERRSKGNLSGFAGPAFEAARPRLAEHLIGGRLDQAGLLDTTALRVALSETGPPRGSDFFRILQIADVESWARRWS